MRWTRLDPLALLTIVAAVAAHAARRPRPAGRAFDEIFYGLRRSWACSATSRCAASPSSRAERIPAREVAQSRPASPSDTNRSAGASALPWPGPSTSASYLLARGVACCWYAGGRAIFWASAAAALVATDLLHLPPLASRDARRVHSDVRRRRGAVHRARPRSASRRLITPWWWRLCSTALATSFGRCLARGPAATQRERGVRRLRAGHLAWSSPGIAEQRRASPTPAGGAPSPARCGGRRCRRSCCSAWCPARVRRQLHRAHAGVSSSRCRGIGIGLARHLGAPARDARLPHRPRRDHPYQSAPWSWPLLKRPVAYWFSDEGGVYREIMALGNPVVWWAGVVARRGLAITWWRSGIALLRPEPVILAAALSTYVPWLILSGDRSQTFLWYLLPTVPFLCLALGTFAAWAWSRASWRIAAAVYGIAVLASFAFWLPWPRRCPSTRTAGACGCCSPTASVPTGRCRRFPTTRPARASRRPAGAGSESRVRKQPAFLQFRAARTSAEG